MNFNYNLTTMYKVQLTFTPEEAVILSFKAGRLGYNITKYVKLLIGREVLEQVERFPEFPISNQARKQVKQALIEHKAGKTIKIKGIDELDRL